LLYQISDKNSRCTDVKIGHPRDRGSICGRGKIFLSFPKRPDGLWETR
jgi:hypothetical protein